MFRRTLTAAEVKAQFETDLVAPPAGYWPMSEGTGTIVPDRSWLRNDGTLVNMDPATAWVRGAIGFSLNFTASTSGSPQRVQLKGVDEQLYRTFSVCMWVQPSATHEIDPQATSGTQGTSGQRYAIEPQHGDFLPGVPTGTRVGFGISIGTNGVSVYGHSSSFMPALAVLEADLSSSTWSHVCVVVLNNVPFIYLDGVARHVGLQSPKDLNFPSNGSFVSFFVVGGGGD